MPRTANHQSSILSRRSGRIALMLIAGATGWPALASASPAFPYALRDAADLECTPVCSVCHTVDPGTRGTATKPFATAMVEAGLRVGDESSVAPAFEVLDPDGDGVPEFEGGEASTVEDFFPCQAEVKYGCGVSPKTTSPSSSGSAHLLWVGLFALGIGLRRRIFGDGSP